MTAFFKHKLAPAIFNGRWVLIGLTLSLLVGGIAAVSTLYTDGEFDVRI